MAITCFVIFVEPVRWDQVIALRPSGSSALAQPVLRIRVRKYPHFIPGFEFNFKIVDQDPDPIRGNPNTILKSLI